MGTTTNGGLVDGGGEDGDDPSSAGGRVATSLGIVQLFGEIKLQQYLHVVGRLNVSANFWQFDCPVIPWILASDGSFVIDDSVTVNKTSGQRKR